MSDPNSDVLIAAMRYENATAIISAMDAGAKDQIPLLTERLSDENSDVRSAAAKALGAVGAVAKDQAPLLAERLGDQDSDVRSAAASALGAMGAAAKDQAPLLAERLTDQNSSVRSAAANALGAMGAAARDQTPLLAERLTDESIDVSTAAARTLSTIGAVTKAQTALLAERIGDKDFRVRLAAARTLGAMGAAAKDQAPRLAKLLADEDWRVRSASVEALGAMGPAAKSHVLALADRLSDENMTVRNDAAQALRAVGMVTEDQVPLLAKLLGNERWRVRFIIAQTLGAMGAAAKDQAPLLAERLDDEIWQVRSAAANALGAMGAAAKDQAPLLAERLGDEIWQVRSAAARALGAMGAAAKDQAPLLAKLLADEDWRVRSASVEALGAMGPAAKSHVLALAEKLNDERWFVRIYTARALGAMGVAAKDQAPLLAERLTDEVSSVRSEAARALGAMGAAAKDQVPLLAERLGDELGHVRSAAAEALGAIGVAAMNQAPLLAKVLFDENDEVRVAAARVLSAMGPFNPDFIPAILTHSHQNLSRTSEVRFMAHFLTGGDYRAEILLEWLSAPIEVPLSRAEKNDEYARAVLKRFAELWPHTTDHSLVRMELANKLERLVSHVRWSDSDVPQLIEHRDNLAAIGSGYAAAIDKKIAAIQRLNWTRWALGIAALHGAFWVALIFAYPRYRAVQAIFFWNPWVRRIAGIGYVGFLLSWVPFLRRRLFTPFRESLLSDARLREFRDADYFPSSEVVEQRNGDRSPVVEAFSDIDGQIVLEGESGLGKSMFLRHLVQGSHRLTVFLDAKRCDNGVLDAIQEMLEGQAKDQRYLRNVIFAGAIDVIVDGINEVSAETRARIIDFARRFSKGNLIITTQPMQWSPPPLATIYVLRPLRDDQIEDFLTSRADSLPKDASVRGEAYTERCRDFLSDTVGGSAPLSAREQYRRVLSNPMDLDVVAQMLSQGERPDLLQLQAQHYRVMADDFKKHNQGHEFPLAKFASRVYEMRRNDETAFGPDEFQDELIAMAKQKMVIPRQMATQEAEEAPLWTFRHDKIMDYFLVQAFLGPNNPRPKDNLGDARFRGTYLLMANLLSLEDAEVLREQLINHAVDTKDHSISDSFIELLRARKAT